MKTIKLAGIIYLHRICDTRMCGSSCDILAMFQEFCGADAAPNVILATTMWSRVEEEEGSRREKQLMEEYWKWFLTNGSITARFLNTSESAWSIADSIIQKSRIRSLQVQDEMVRFHRRVNDTQAGTTLCETLRKALTRQMHDCRELQDVAQERNNAELVRELQMRYQKIREDYSRTYDDLPRTYDKISLVRQILLFLNSTNSRAVSSPCVIMYNCN
jgi:hypothetical protein